MIECTITGEDPARLVAQLQFSPSCEVAVERFAIDFLRGRNFVVQALREWEQPKAFCFRLGISLTTFSRRTRDVRAAGLFVADYGRQQGQRLRIHEIASTPAFDHFAKTGNLPAA